MSGATLSKRDMALVMAYIEGHLSEKEQIQLELRLGDEPALERELIQLMDGDVLLDELLGEEEDEGAEPHRSARRVGPAWRWLAAAAVALAFIGLLSHRGDSGEHLRVAVMPSWRTLDEYRGGWRELTDLHPPTESVTRGPGEEEGSVGTAEEFLRVASELEGRLRDAALEESATSITAEFFLLPIELPEAAHIVVLGIPETGAPRRLLPDPMVGPLRAASLPAGRHLLPEARVQVVEGPDGPVVRYVRGFTVLREEGTLRVLVASRSTPPGADDLRELDAELEDVGAEALDPEAAESRLSDALLGRGYSVAGATVVEP